MSVRTIAVTPFVLALFGATGDLAFRKVFPALYMRMRAGQMPKSSTIIALARSKYTHEEFRDRLKAAIQKSLPSSAFSQDHLEDFCNMISYLPIDLKAKDSNWAALQSALHESPHAIKIAYLAVTPDFFSPICQRLAAMNEACADMRIVIEKPFGKDEASAAALNKEISSYFPEKQLYRIDHYLGKETVQNLMAIRFANSLFHQIWNSQDIDHIQISVAEDIGVAGRGGYFDQSGTMRDMIQNHLMQLLCLVAMEPPAQYNADAVRAEKLKVIEALRPINESNINDHVVLGQYRAGGGVAGYCDDIGKDESDTETYVAMRCEIANFRWNNTPFYLRSGKRLPSRLSEILIAFKPPNHSIFNDAKKDITNNSLIIRLQPDEAIQMIMTIKTPGPGGFRLSEVAMDMSFSDMLQAEQAELPEAYERLLMDVVRGDQTLFMRGDEVEAAWRWIDPIIKAKSHAPLHKYDATCDGPKAAQDLMRGHIWRPITSKATH